MLAVLLSIAKGFGFQNIVESQLFYYFPGQRDVFGKAFGFVDSYMQHSHDGVFLGLGLLLLFYTVYSLIAIIEKTFNNIWQVPKGRSFGRQLTDYFSTFLLIPVFLVCSAGVSILMATMMNTLKQYEVISDLAEVLIIVAPILLNLLIFVFLYMFIPNTKVKFKHAIYGGIFAAISFQVFQYLYINGQIWVSRYNAIYGSFALLPLLLLWMQLSWVICLIGAEITYASQNLQNYEYEVDSKNISRRYSDFISLTIANLIFKRFEAGKPAYTAGEISSEYKIPIRLTKSVLLKLVDLELLNEIKDEEKSEVRFQPAIDINQITIAVFFEKIDRYGSENFKIDHEQTFHAEYEAILQSRRDMFLNNKELLIKDIA
jgi:membrane protein